MIIDAHTHVFPPTVIARRGAICAFEPTFAEIYGDPAAKMATTDELIASMDAAGIDASIICNFAWHGSDLVEETNAYILEAAAASGGRLIPFVSVHFGEGFSSHGRGDTEEAPSSARSDIRTTFRRLATAGARGVGELRPASSGYNLANSDEADILGWAAAAFDLPLLFHVSEPVGHAYPGKQGLPVETLYAFAKAAAGVTIIGAHWGGGLPFYTLMPEVREALEQAYFDTAASHLLYDEAVYRRVIDAVGGEKILWGSDFPLTTQAKALERTRAGGLDEGELDAILGGNVAALLNL
jgi:predicted TIM-barrel fold metal-dependent hydrolase